MLNVDGGENVAPGTFSPLSKRQRVTKRIFDLVVSIPLIIVLSPIFILLCVLVKSTSRGTIIFRAQRIGLNGKPFTMYKFRSMVETDASRTHKIVSHQDHRVTKIGRIIRRTKLDELPQFFNVVNGTMSIVGPRPQNADFISRYTDEERAVLRIRPGITGPGTVVNYEKLLTGATPEENEKIYFETLLPDRLRCELVYLKDWSLKTDIQIIGRTMVSMISRSNDRRVTPLYRSPRAT